MRKIFLFLMLFSVSGLAAAAPLPDNVYFRAMKDEMTRSLDKLHVKNGPKPYYLAYQLQDAHHYCEGASFGQLSASSDDPSHQLSARVVLAAGSPKNDSMGFTSDEFRYAPSALGSVAQSYWGIRRALWSITDNSYLNASEMYEKKQAYKRQKNLTDELPDFVPAKQASFVEEIPPFPQVPREQMQEWVQNFSARGKDIPYLESFSVNLCLSQDDWYYLNSDGGFYQYATLSSSAVVWAEVRNKDGYKIRLQRQVTLPKDFTRGETAVQTLVDRTLQEAAQFYQATKAEPYIGPVLMMPEAAADFINRLLVANVRNVKPLLSDEDKTAGAFRNKAGMRVMSPVADVLDKPLLREYRGVPLWGFKPVDDEGVLAQDLTVVSGGKLHELPLSRRPAQKGQTSNGHAHMSDYTLPRESLSNVFVEPKTPLSQAEMEAKLLARCRELELDYCYILKEFPVSASWANSTINIAERIYTKDGRREPVFGLKVSELSTRSLRDILAAGDDAELFDMTDAEYRPYTLVVPSLVVDELELLPSDKKADRKPFVPKP